MKKGGIFVIALLILFSCTAEKEGDWDDNIKLSQKEFQFDGSESIAMIETEGDSWWISEVFFKEDKQFDISYIDTTSENFMLSESDFILERKNGKEIILTLFENNTNAERILVKGLQAGNYFDAIVIKQSAE